jgi:MOSC domain-containing protein YiiM
MDEQGWLDRFRARAVPGAYLRVVTPGSVQAGDPLGIEFRPPHHVTIAFMFRALTLEPELFPDLFEASEYLIEELRAVAPPKF